MKWITALDLDQWANSLQARAEFPALVRELIRASVDDIAGIRFPSGDKSQVRGFDGVLSSKGAAPFVPEGDSIWEFGAGEKASSKADTDYAKRTAGTSQEVREKTTFAFVTPRTWDRDQATTRDEWIRSKRALKEWKSVDFIDGVMLEDWLIQHPAVASRNARYVLRLVQRPAEVLSTSEFWEEFSHRYAPPLTEDVLLCDRTEQANRLVAALAAGKGQTSLVADSPDEVIAFAVAAIRKADLATREFLESRTLIIDTPEAARILSAKPGLVFFPRGQAHILSGVLAKSGAVLTALGRDERKAQHEFLKRPSSFSMGEAMVTMGMERDAAVELARRCGRSVTILERMRSSGKAQKPTWLSRGAQLLPAMLAGSWNSAYGLDKDALTELAGKDKYDVVEAPLRELAELVDPPIDRVDDVWAMRAPVDAFIHLGRQIGDEDLSRLRSVATKVFSTLIDRPSPEELFDRGRDRSVQYSEWLREGLATTLLQVAVLHDEVNLRISGSTPQAFVNSLIRDLPGLSSNHRLLDSLRDNLPLLAEAAPDPFLEALERLLEGEAQEAKLLFSEGDEFFAPSSPHVSILFALEVLAWDPILLPRVASVLARLDAIDPGGKVSNRPINSLRSIFLSWAPNTNATVVQRLDALDAIVDAYPTTGWKLLVKLLPRSGDTSSPSSRPKFREAGASEAKDLTWGMVWESQRGIIDRALKLAEGKSERLVKIVKSMSNFEQPYFLKSVSVIERYLASRASRKREEVWEVLHSEVTRHKTYQNAKWTLKGDALRVLDELVLRYQPDDAVGQHVWLFNDWLHSLPGMGSEIDTEAVEGARRSAIRRILDQSGLDGFKEMLRTVKHPQLAASPFARLDPSLSDYATMVEWGSSQGGDARAFSVMLSAHAFDRYKQAWVEVLKEWNGKGLLSSEEIATLLQGFKNCRETWDIASTISDQVVSHYWEQSQPYAFSGDSNDLLLAVTLLARGGRANAALALLRDRSTEVPASEILRVLEQAIGEVNANPGRTDTMFAYYASGVIKALESRADVSEDDLGRIEFAYLRILESEKHDWLIYKLVVREPQLFCEMISAVFKSKDEGDIAISEDRRARASVAYQLLSSIRIVPGQNGEIVDAAELRRWCLEARRLVSESGRKEIGEQYIGQILARAPRDPKDGAWPHASVRAVVQEMASDDVERGIEVARFNLRGTYSKALLEGGDQERALASEARAWAKACEPYPRVAAMLNRISRSWEEMGRGEDQRIEQEKLRM